MHFLIGSVMLSNQKFFPTSSENTYLTGSELLVPYMSNFFVHAYF